MFGFPLSLYYICIDILSINNTFFLLETHEPSVDGVYQRKKIVRLGVCFGAHCAKAALGVVQSFLIRLVRPPTRRLFNHTFFMKTYDVLGFDYFVEGEWIRMYDYEPGRWRVEISEDGNYRDVCFRGGGELLSGHGFGAMGCSIWMNLSD